MSGVPCCGNGDGHEHGCLDALAISLSSIPRYKNMDFQLVIKRLKGAGLYSAEDQAMARCGNILPESVIGQLLPADTDEASREALYVIFDVGRQALPEAVTEQTGYIRGANWYGQLLVALSCWFVQHVSHASFSSAQSTVTFTGLYPLCRFQPSVQKVVRIYVGGGKMFPVSGRIGYTLSSVQFVFLSAFSSKGDKPSIASCCFLIVVFRFGQYFADAKVC